ncbi:electron transport complex subunit RsxC [Marinagarivorans algicola]|uniref:electron transport complex subunit RsxC n=1 Tax=Marinagarivorans algicola TaxID=1513270 RepID=UPI0006B8A61C|nr:electron transport complex subunit RsxC [Marinagarivorans algicola]
MTSHTIWEVPGGIHPPENKAQSMAQALAECPLAPEYILPLNQHIGAPSAPLVSVGQSVKKYQLIADAEGIFSAALHAPTSGTISAIEERLIAHPSGLSAPCIVIAPDGLDEACPLEPCEQPFALEHAAIVAKIRQAGLVGMGGAGFPSAVKLNPHANTSINTLIINGTECEPYITADDMLMQTHTHELLEGVRLLAHTLGNPDNVLIGVEDNKPEAIAALQEAAHKANQKHGCDIQVVSFPTKYPSGGEKQLIYILTGQEVESGKIPASLGIVVQNVGTAVAAWRAVRYGEPLIERITTVVGQSLQVQRNMRVRIGTPMNFVLEQNGFMASQSARLIVGGPMMGYALEQTCVPVIKTTNCLLAPSHSEMPEAPPQQACIRCGHCAEACPAGLLPQQLYWYARSDEHEKLEAHHLFDCIECGACSYVCPSSIPLVQYYRAAKGDIRKAAADKLKSDKARERFEHRQERLAKEEAAKEAKRQARKAAAELNKAKMAAQQAATETSHSQNSASTSTHKDIQSPTIPAIASAEELVANAATAAKAQQDPTLDKARLSRTVESLASSITRMKAQMAEAVSEGLDPSRIEKMAAKLKQTELKAQEAKTKLDAFDKTLAASMHVDAAAQKMMANPQDAAAKTLSSLQKRLSKAQELHLEALNENKPSADALKQGVIKLEQKIEEAKQALSEAQNAAPSSSSSEPQQPDAAAAAIERAKQKVQAAASMTPEQKAQAAVESLQKRLSKAQERYAKAQETHDENLEAFATGVEKLELKLKAAMEAQQEGSKQA